MAASNAGTTQITRADLVPVSEPAFPRGAYRGEYMDADGNYVANVYLHDGRGHIALPKEFGHGEIVARVLETFDPKAFVKAGGLQVSAAQRVQYWTLRARARADDAN